jgi:SMODS and SLOG-associating 2TM effector domain 1/Protein of unknown function (DUF4231)
LALIAGLSRLPRGGTLAVDGRARVNLHRGGKLFCPWSECAVLRCVCMNSANESDLLSWAWDRQSIWSQAADRLKRYLFWSRTAALLLTIAAAVFVTAAAQLADLSSAAGKVLSWLAAVCASLVALMQASARPERVREWMRTRSVSEALKAETYTFLAGVSPYRGADRQSIFRKNLDTVLEDAADLEGKTIGIEPVQRAIPSVSDVDSYSTVRVQGQVSRYYRPKSVAMNRRAQLFRAIETGLAVAAALLSATAAVSGHEGWAAWLPVITTITAAVAAEAAVQRYSALAAEYARTYAELERLLRDRHGAVSGSATADDAFVHDAERVISLQNEAWMARGVAAADKAWTAQEQPDR